MGSVGLDLVSERGMDSRHIMLRFSWRVVFVRLHDRVGRHALVHVDRFVENMEFFCMLIATPGGGK